MSVLLRPWWVETSLRNGSGRGRRALHLKINIWEQIFWSLMIHWAIKLNLKQQGHIWELHINVTSICFKIYDGFEFETKYYINRVNISEFSLYHRDITKGVRWAWAPGQNSSPLSSLQFEIPFKKNICLCHWHRKTSTDNEVQSIKHYVNITFAFWYMIDFLIQNNIKSTILTCFWPNYKKIYNTFMVTKVI